MKIFLFYMFFLLVRDSIRDNTHDSCTTGSSNANKGDTCEEDELDGFEAFPSQYQRVDTSDK